jgi:hypothetical protein
MTSYSIIVPMGSNSSATTRPAPRSATGRGAAVNGAAPRPLLNRPVGDAGRELDRERLGAPVPAVGRWVLSYH